MATVTFDKLAYLETLKASGVPEAQARAHTQALDSALHDAVATRQDIAELKHEMDIIKRDLTIRLGGMLTIAIGVVAALIKLL